MASKRSSEGSVKSRSSLPRIDTPKTVEEEHGGPWYTMRDDNLPMVLNPLGNQELHPSKFRRNHAVGGSVTARAVTLRILGNMGNTTELPFALLGYPAFQTPGAPNRPLRNSIGISNLKF